MLNTPVSITSVNVTDQKSKIDVDVSKKRTDICTCTIKYWLLHVTRGAEQLLLRVSTSTRNSAKCYCRWQILFDSERRYCIRYSLWCVTYSNRLDVWYRKRRICVTNKRQAMCLSIVNFVWSLTFELLIDNDFRTLCS